MSHLIRCLDLLQEHYPLVEKDELYAAVMCGEVSVDGHTVRDPQATVRDDALLAWKPKGYVSRGGLKLDYALSAWNIDVSAGGFLDAGASTGGFTDCLLSRGAPFVHAVDVGYNQLNWKLRSDNRVYVHERTNIMLVESLKPRPMAAVADLSFRSLRRVLTRILSLTREEWCLALVKPQFEYAGDNDAFDGVVRDERERSAVVRLLLSDLREEDVYPQRILRSPILGRKGNVEYLILFGREEVLKEADYQVSLV